MASTELCFLTATEMAHRVRQGDLSAREVMHAHLEQIEKTNPSANAIVTLLAEQALQHAADADEAWAHGNAQGPLHGLPVAHKDLVNTKGVRTTFGSPLFKDFVPTEDALIAERLRDAGAIMVGKTNTPEFGAGSQTFNAVFGATLNPYDLTRTCGGSSGGAAVALACGMVPIADGSDLGGSLRNPAAFCNVVGLRTSPGRIPAWPRDLGWFPLAVEGPMARTAEDAALMLAAMAGPDPRSPISIAEHGQRFLQPLDRDFRNVPVAWCGNLGSFPVDKQVTEVLDSQRTTFEDLGCVIDDAHPDFRDADEAFRVWRAWSFELRMGDLVREHPDKFKETIHWNVEQGEQLTGPQISRAEQKRTALYHRVRQFMETHAFLVMPATQVVPFDVRKPFVDEINGEKMTTYIDWMKACYYITVTGLPAISVPCGFTDDGLPVGVQIVGRHQDDFGVLQLAYAFQEATGVWKRRPPGMSI